jgi:hypothetical protein
MTLHLTTVNRTGQIEMLDDEKPPRTFTKDEAKFFLDIFRVMNQGDPDPDSACGHVVAWLDWYARS